MTTIREVSNTLRSQKDSSSQLILPSSGHADLKFVLPGLSAPPLTLKGKCGISNFLVFLLELFSQNSCNLCRRRFTKLRCHGAESAVRGSTHFGGACNWMFHTTTLLTHLNSQKLTLPRVLPDHPGRDTIGG